MISNAAKRTILRWVHLLVTIPILGCIYNKPAEVAQYVSFVRLIFVPLIFLTGYWMYAGMIFAVIGVAAWMGANCVSGFGAAILSQVVLLIARKIWLMTRRRRIARSDG